MSYLLCEFIKAAHPSCSFPPPHPCFPFFPLIVDLSASCFIFLARIIHTFLSPLLLPLLLLLLQVLSYSLLLALLLPVLPPPCRPSSFLRDMLRSRAMASSLLAMMIYGDKAGR